MNPVQLKPVRLWSQRLGRALLLGGLAFTAGAALAQALNDIPMAVKNNVAPNFMFMIDNSGSMSNIVPELPFNAAVTYASGPDSCPAATTGSNNIVIPAAGTTVNLNIILGVPHARIGGTDRRHTTQTTSGNRVCFLSAATYTASLLSPVGSYLPAQYTGNYLNWYFGTYGGHPADGWTTRKRVTAGAGSVRTRLEIAKSSAVAVMNTLQVTTPANVRVGLSTYNTATSGDGGQFLRGVADFTTTHQSNLVASINAITPFGNTPLAETLADIGRYMATGYTGNITAGDVTGVSIDNFLRQNSRDSCLRGAVCTGNDGVPASPSVGTPARPIQLWCQRSYAFLMTDGRPQGDQELSNNTHLRDYDKDCQQEPGGVDRGADCVGGSAGAVANWDRKLVRQYEGQGSDYLDDVAKALFDVDLRPNLPGPTYVVDGVTLNRKGRNNLVTYTIGFADLQVLNDPLLKSAAKQGGGKAYFPTTESELTGAFNAVITDAFSTDAAAAAVAVANAQITVNNVGYASNYRAGAWYGDLVAYSLNPATGDKVGGNLWSLRDNLRGVAPSSRKIVTYNGSAGVAFAVGLAYTDKPSSLTDSVINYVRGDRSAEIPAGTLRTRQDVLGDIINAEPLVVNYGSVPIIFQGSNGGMLHVVDGRTDASTPTRGQELWAYVPKLVHANLSALTEPDYDHLYYVDGTPAAAEVTGMGSVNRLLVGSLGKGGRGYYALDISSYTAATQADAASKVLWEFSPPGMGFSFGTPLIVKVGSNWRVVVASGYGATVHGVWVIDPTTGVGPFIAAPLASGLAHLGKLANTTADADTRYVWGGDNQGNVYRFDLVSLSSARIAVLTDATGSLAQPVTSAPTVARVSGSTTRFLVQLGTGRYLADADVPGAGANAEATQRQTLYGLVDNTAVVAPTMPSLRGTNGSSCPSGGGNGDLVCQALSYDAASDRYRATANAVDLGTQRGWYLDLPTAVEPAGRNMINGRVINRPGLTARGTLVATINIPTNVQCQPGGRSWFLQLNSATGGAIPRFVGGNTYFDAGFSLGEVLSSRVELVIGSEGTVGQFQGSDGKPTAKKVDETASTAAPWRRIYWRAVK